MGAGLHAQHAARAERSERRYGELGRDLQHLLLARPGAARHRADHDADLALCRPARVTALRAVREQCLQCGEGGVIVTLRTFAFQVERVHSFWLAMRAPSARVPSFAQAIAGSTVGAPAKVAKPQSTPAMTFARPTRSA